MPSGRPDDVADLGGLKIAGILKNDNCRLKALLGEAYVEIPWRKLTRTKPLPLPDDASWVFFGKDLGPSVRGDWSVYHVEPEYLTCEQRLNRALGVYDWVMEAKPDAVVVWTDAYPELRAACLAATALKHPSFEIRHGGFATYTHGHWEARGFASHRLGSWEYRAWHKFYDVDGEAVATGNPTLDVWSKADTSALRETARRELRIPTAATVVTYLGDTPFERTAWQDRGLADGTLAQFLSAWITARRIVSDAHLIFKRHPYDVRNSLDNYRALIEKGAKLTTDYTLIDDNLVLALAPSDLCVGPRSTAMISALMLGIPSLIIDYTPFFEEHMYAGRGFEVARTPIDILSKLVYILTDSRRMGALIDETPGGVVWFSGAQDCMASVRATRVIAKVTRGEALSESDLCPL